MTETLISILQECEDNKQMIEDVKSRPYAVDLLAHTLDPESLAIPQLIQAMQTAIYINIPIEHLLDEFLFRVAAKSRLMNKYYLPCLDSYKLSPEVPPFIAHALKAKYGPAPYKSYHLNIMTDMSVYDSAKLAAQIDNFALFKRCHIGITPARSVGSLRCFKYAILDEPIQDEKQLRYLMYSIFTEGCKEVLNYVLQHFPIPQLTYAEILPLLHKDRADTLDILFAAGKIIPFQLVRSQVSMIAKAPGCAGVILKNTHTPPAQDAVVAIFDSCVYHDSTPILEVLANAGIVFPIETLDIIIASIPKKVIQFLVERKIPAPQFRIGPGAIKNIHDIEALDSINFNWSQCILNADLYGRYSGSISRKVLEALLDRCRWDSSIYKSYLQDATDTFAVMICHNYAKKHHPQHCLTPERLIQLQPYCTRSLWIELVGNTTDKCVVCSNDASFIFACPGCYVRSYCSSICRDSDKETHRATCNNVFIPSK